MTLIRFLVLCGLLVAAYDAAAAPLEIPLRVSLDTLREALGTQLASYRDGPCRYLRLRPAQLRLQSEQGRLRLSVPGRGALGVPLSGKCQTAAAWQGTMHFTLEPHIDSSGRLRVRIVDSRLGDARGGAAPIIWDLGKRHLHPQLERFSYDLGASREALTALLLSAAPPVHATAMGQTLQQLQVLQPQVETTHVVVPIALEIPDAWLAAAPPAAASGAPLSEAELEALEKALEPWDAFLVYVLRQVALDGEDSELRRRLFNDEAVRRRPHEQLPFDDYGLGHGRWCRWCRRRRCAGGRLWHVPPVVAAERQHLALLASERCNAGRQWIGNRTDDLQAHPRHFVVDDCRVAFHVEPWPRAAGLVRLADVEARSRTGELERLDGVGTERRCRRADGIGLLRRRGNGEHQDREGGKNELMHPRIVNALCRFKTHFVGLRRGLPP